MILALLLLPILTVLPIQETQPVSLEILFDGVPAVGGGWVLTVTLKANTNVVQSEIEVVHSNGLSVNSGLTYWKGSLAADDERVMEIAYSLLKKSPQKIIVRVKGQTLEGIFFKKKEHRLIEIE